MNTEDILVCANQNSLEQADRFSQRLLGGVEVRSFEDLHGQTSMHPILVYLTHPDDEHLRSFLKVLKPARPDVVIYYASRVSPQDAVQLGKLVGETRPAGTSVVFEAREAADSVLQHSRSRTHKYGEESSNTRMRHLRGCFRLTQTEFAHALGISLRTVQNWETTGVVGKPHKLRDLEELWAILRESMKSSEVAPWFRSANEAFSGKSPIELLKDGKARDIIVEFRRLQAGEPI